MQMKNDKGEYLYKVVKTSSNNLKALVTIKTKEAALEWIEEYTHDVDNANWFRKVINNDIKDGVGELEFVEDHKGWGYDYLVRIEVSPLYCF